MSVLFEPFSIRGMELPNRVAMAPMTRVKSPGGVPGADVAEYYRKRAQYGVGLIISEGTVVDRPESSNDPDIPRFHGDAALAGWQNIIDTVHAEGGRMAPQIWHTGIVPANRKEHPRQQDPEGPSGLGKDNKRKGAAMSEEDVADTVAAFAKACTAAAQMGFDCVELHGAHGYLIDQFFWHETNQRSDKWGGPTIADRASFAREIVKETRKGIGDLPLILRISQWKQQDYSVKLAPTPADLDDWLAPLHDAGVDMFHCSQRRFWEPEFPDIDGENGLNFAGWVKKALGVPTISVGSVSLDNDFFGSFGGQKSASTDLRDLERRMEAEEFDMIAVGRALIANPDWADKVKAGHIDQLAEFDGAQLGVLN